MRALAAKCATAALPAAASVMVAVCWLRSVPFTIQARQTAQDRPVQVQHSAFGVKMLWEDHQTGAADQWGC